MTVVHQTPLATLELAPLELHLSQLYYWEDLQLAPHLPVELLAEGPHLLPESSEQETDHEAFRLHAPLKTDHEACRLHASVNLL